MSVKIMGILSFATSIAQKIVRKIKDTLSFVQILVLFVCISILLSVFLSVAISDTRRFVFFFPDSHTNTIRTEVRYLPKLVGNDVRLKLYANETLLGPIKPNLSSLFSRKTSVLQCFMRGKTAYIDLSADAAYPDPGMIETELACKIFKKNVFTNFRNIDKIYLYIDGIEVYRERPIVDAD